MRRLGTHPAAMLFALGNEIPPPVVRWYGRKRIERFLSDLYDEARSAAPDALLTYINYPPTEYLETPFFDVCAFNVFLHSEAELSAYLARLHHIAGPRPLLISELGADSLRNGDEGQSALVRMQVQTALREGACGAVVFTWTDDWWRGGRVVDDWAFGLVDADRRPKPAYRTVQGVFRAPVHAGAPTPRVSVVVCAYNAIATIDECLDALEQVNYPDFEVIVVNDGSTDGTGPAAARHRSVRVINTPNAGLSAARNVGLHHATGEIVAYTDADVRVDPEWLTYLVQPICRAGGRRRRRTGDHSPGRPVVRAVRRTCARRSDARPPRRSHRRARAGLQLRLSARRPARDRRVQPGVPARWRRRGRVLAYSGTGLDRGVRAGGPRVAPAPGHDTGVLPAADWLR